MTFDYTLTINGTTADHLSSLLDRGVTPTSFRVVMFQADGANTHDVFIGGTNHAGAVSSTSYGFLLPKPVTSEPAAPVVVSTAPGQSVELSDFWVIGTASEKVHIFCIA